MRGPAAVTEHELVRPDGTRLWFERRSPAGRPPDGTRRVVVLCPPGGRNAAWWDPAWVDELTALGLVVVRLDWRGQGRSDWDPTVTGEPVAAEVLVDDLTAVLDEVDAAPDGAGPVLEGGAPPAGSGTPRYGLPVAPPPTAHDAAADGPPPNADGDVAAVTARPSVEVIGAGLGGWVAARLAQRRPVARLLVFGASAWWCDPALPGPDEPTVVALALRRRGGGPGDVRRAVSREAAVELGRSGPLDGTVLRAEVDRWFAHGFNPHDTHWVTRLAAPPLPEERPAGRPEVVVLHGAADPVVPPAHGRALADRWGARFVELAGAGHHATAPALAALLDVLRVPPGRDRAAPV